MKKKKVLAVASSGGHWTQLLRLTKVMQKEIDIVYISTLNHNKDFLNNNTFYCVTDFSRWDFLKAIPVFWGMLKIVNKELPDVILTTGAAPGLICLLAGSVMNKKTIWVDSIANMNRLSLSGRIAILFATKVYTQWRYLANNRVVYTGNILNDSQI